MHNHLGYDVTCSAARPYRSRGSQGGVGLVKLERPVRWRVKSTCYHGPSMVSCKVVTRITKNPLVRVYLPLLTLEKLTDLEETLQRFREPIFPRDLNMDLDKSRRSRSQLVADLLTEYVLLDLVCHFLQHCMSRNQNI